jgi:hypothetical protein
MRLIGKRVAKKKLGALALAAAASVLVPVTPVTPQVEKKKSRTTIQKETKAAR